MQRSKTIPASGFTLIELMIVVAIAASLVAIAVPSYQSQIRHGRRTDAKTALLDAVVREEKYLTLSNSYTTTPTNIGYPATTPIAIGSGYYNLNICVSTASSPASSTACASTTTGQTGTFFVVSAIPTTGSSQLKDTDCLYFAVDNTGAQWSSNNAAGTGTTNTTSTCWQ